MAAYTLTLTNSDKVTIIDASDKELTDKVRNWSLNGSGYPHGQVIGGGRAVSLHRLILADELAKPENAGLEVDHINNDRLDNRRVNLRVVTRSTNLRNCRMIGGSSRFPGVYWNKSASKWIARIRIPSVSGRGNGRRQHLGTFTNEKEAARAYRARAKSIDPALDFPVWKELDEEPTTGCITNYFKTV